jgi:hypothetical protein
VGDRTGARPDVGLCTGKDCRRADGFRTVQRELGRECDLVELPCLDVCDGVVVVVAPRSSAPVVLERVNSRGIAREIVAHVVAGEALSGRLRRRRVTGSARAKAHRRIRRALR